MDIEIIKEQERAMQFNRFDNNTAIDIGLKLLEAARDRKYPVTIDITRCRHQLFHASLPGTTSANDEWIRRKVNSVYRFETSSLILQLNTEKSGRTFQDQYFVDPDDYVAAGGSFPVRVINTGFVGTITVSGMTSQEDHNLIIEVLKSYLKIED